MANDIARKPSLTIVRREVAVLLYPGCVFLEIAPVLELLAPKFDVSYYTPDGSLHFATNGTRLVATGSYADASARALDSVIVPGGNPDSIIDAGLANECLAAAHQRGALLGGICAGVLVLARSGLLRGRRATHNYTREHASQEVVSRVAPILDGIAFERADLVIDGPFITAQHWASFKFAAALAQELGLFSSEQTAKYIASRQYSYGDA